LAIRFGDAKLTQFSTMPEYLEIGEQGQWLRAYFWLTIMK
jgi:hypothetical protein